MNLFFLMPLIPFIGGALTLVYHFRNENTNLLTNMFILISLCVSLILIDNINHQALYYEFAFFSIDGLDLKIKLQIDNLSIVMLLLINFISFIMHRYSTNYLASDPTQGRFMAQLSVLTAAVSLLVISGNLLTAFIGWQFVGLSLYILLNHYHYDTNANKSAKKKFIINRIGDLSFLTAVVLCYVYFGNSDFNLINSTNDININFLGYWLSLNSLIVCLIFIAVMTKSAQFPFHIWLADTMQAPTPVSAIMHAGVINSGGFLLARISQMVNLSDFASNFIFTIGVLTVVSAAFFMISQSDVKKQLAYSTMGQMGFMIIQCSIGLYTAAIFHLIAHGFFKAFLFLNAGNNIQLSSNPQKDAKPIFGFIALFLSLIIIGAYYQYAVNFNVLSNAYLISVMFIAITIAQLISELLKLKQYSLSKILFIFIIGALVFSYIYFGHLLDHLINTTITNDTSKIDKYKVVISGIIFIIQGLIWLSPVYIKFIPNTINLHIYHLSRNKLFIEELYRKILLEPYRKSGDWFNQLLFKGNLGRIILFGITICSLVYSYMGVTQKTHFAQLSIILLNQLVFIILIASANRALNIRMLNTYILVAQVNLINMGLFSLVAISPNLAFFQIINSLLIFIAIELILRAKSRKLEVKNTTSNSLALNAMYLKILLFLWIGIPGTASFVSEINIMYSLALDNLILALIAGVGFIMLAIAVLHALQEHVFNIKSEFLASNAKLSLKEHIFIVLCIGINVFNGIHPSWLLNKLA